MSDNFKLYLIIMAVGLVVTMIRIMFASRDSEAKQAEAKQKQEANDSALTAFVSRSGGVADKHFSTGCASAALDSTNGMLYVVSDAVGGEKKFDLKNVESVKVIDKSAEYQEVLKLEQLRSGVDRGSMMNPARGHSMRELKEGHQRFEDWIGRIVYGMELKFRDGSESVTIPFYNADSTVFWTEEQNLQACKKFADDVKLAI